MRSDCINFDIKLFSCDRTFDCCVFQDEFGVDECDKCPFTPVKVTKAEDKIIDKEISCTFLGKLTCYWFYRRSVPGYFISSYSHCMNIEKFHLYLLILDDSWLDIRLFEYRITGYLYCPEPRSGCQYCPYTGHEILLFTIYLLFYCDSKRLFKVRMSIKSYFIILSLVRSIDRAF